MSDPSALVLDDCCYYHPDCSPSSETGDSPIGMYDEDFAKYKATSTAKAAGWSSTTTSLTTTRRGAQASPDLTLSTPASPTKSPRFAGLFDVCVGATDERPEGTAPGDAKTLPEQGFLNFVEEFVELS